jgi:hypothetical protein
MVHEMSKSLKLSSYHSLSLVKLVEQEFYTWKAASNAQTDADGRPARPKHFVYSIQGYNTYKAKDSDAVSNWIVAAGFLVNLRLT